MDNAWAIIASGASLTKEDVSLIYKAKQDNIITGVIAVSNVGIDMAPWADCLVSHDSAWWLAHPEALEFKGEKICSNNPRGCIRFRPEQLHGCNSGLMAMDYAWREKRARFLLLLGFDMHGTHYFGKHRRPKLKNTSPQRFKYHIGQFSNWHGCAVVNCTPNSALKKFPFKPLEQCLIDVASS